MSDSSHTTEMRCEIRDLYFWLGEEAEIAGFTPWQTAWLVTPRPIVIARFLYGNVRPAESADAK